MAGRYPWFPVYVDDFTTSRKVLAMDAAEVGVYVLLLMSQWKDGPIPDDDNLLAAICKGEVNTARTVLEMCFELTDEGWINERLEEIREAQREKRQQKVRAGEASGKARRRKKIERRSNAVRTPLEQKTNNTEVDTEPEPEKPQDLPREASSVDGVDNSRKGQRHRVSPEILKNPWGSEQDDRGEKVMQALARVVRRGKIPEYARQIAQAKPGQHRDRIYEVASDILADWKAGEVDEVICQQSLVKAINNR